MKWRAISGAVALFVCCWVYAEGHGYMSVPKARQLVKPGIYAGDVQSLAAGGPTTESVNGHGLCGDIYSRRMFSDGYDQNPAVVATYVSGQTIDITVVITAHHWGWFEFRLCDGATLTQECLNKYVLEFDKSYTESQYTNAMRTGQTSPADYKGDGSYSIEHAKCAHIPLNGPSGSCCRGGGTCSSEADNKNRWVLPDPAKAGKTYTMRYKLPQGVTCDRCILQWYWQTGNSIDAYPEAFWNCADIKITGNGGQTPVESPVPSPVPNPVATPVESPVPSPIKVVEQPDPKCENGILNGIACCAASCGTCGGEGCNTFPGGADSCCFSKVSTSDRPCEEYSAPCVYTAPSESSCPPAYVEGTAYVAGQQVESGGEVYACKAHPYTPWCASAASAYAPGTGTAWDQAWTLVAESCSDVSNPVASPVPSPVQNPVPNPVESPVPNPVESPVPSPVEDPAGEPDPKCERGILSGIACCAASCGQCGGEGCSSLPGGASSCCYGQVSQSTRSCDEFSAPCVYTPRDPSCPPKYVEGTGYTAGAMVENQGKVYQCRTYPNSGWCKGVAWAYAPGTGSDWEDAWMLVAESCDGVSNPVASPVPNPVPNPVQSPVPNPVPNPVQNPVPSPVQSPVQNPVESTGTTAEKLEKALERAKADLNSQIFIYEKAQGQWAESTLYRYDAFLSGLKVMYEKGVAGQKFYIGEDSESLGYIYGLVNIAAFLAQSMKESIKYNACDENNWDLIGNKYPLSNACGQLGQSYQDYSCPADEKHMECPLDASMTITATTNAKWYGAPGPLKCGPKSTYPIVGYWDYTAECNKPWSNPPEYCTAYEGQVAGKEVNLYRVANGAGRTDVENCCWWGRGVIQLTGRCNTGRLNYYLGKRAYDEGRADIYRDVDFCKQPDAICASTKYPELKWVAGYFYWINSLQNYNSGGWDYLTELRKFVDGGLKGDTFINAVSGIVNRGCHNPPCATGAVDGGPERIQNFNKVLSVLGLTANRSSEQNTNQPRPSGSPSDSSTGSIAGPVVGGTIVGLLAVAGVLVGIRKYKNSREPSQNPQIDIAFGIATYKV